MHRLAKELAIILATLSGCTKSFVKNSSEFVQRVNQVTLDEQDKMVSFDVVSLSTRAPVNDAIQVILFLLREDETLSDRTNIPLDEICQLMELCLRSTYFQFKDRYFELVEVAAMGSTLSPVIANLYMESFESLGGFPFQTHTLGKIRG